MNKQYVLKFISTIRNSFIGADYVYTNGSCFQFYRILKCVFPQAIAYYNGDHIVSMIDGRMYDVNGEIECSSSFLPLSDYHNEEQFKNLKYEIKIS